MDQPAHRRGGPEPQAQSLPPRAGRAFVGFCLAALLLSLLVSGGSAQGAVRFDMFVGYDGLVPHGSWFPVTFEVQNDGPAFVGTVEVTPGQFSAGHERTMAVELPTGTIKRFTIPVFSTAAWSPSWKARLLDERRRVHAETESQNLRRFNATIFPVAAAMSRHAPTLPEGKSRQENMRAMVGRLPSAVFPENPIVLDGLDVLYLSSERALDLKVNQVSALLGWLHGGGHLIVSIEQPNHLDGSGEWLRRVLPVEVTGLATGMGQAALHQWVTGKQRADGTDYDFLGPAPTQGGALQARPGINPFAQLNEDPAFVENRMQVAQVRVMDGRVLVGTDAQPLVTISRRGLGQLTVLAFAPELEPFRGWKNAPYFWAKMVDLPPDVLLVDYPNRSFGRSMDGVFGAMLDSRQIRKLPVGWLLLLLLAYLVVIGPLDQYWLKKLNRQMLTWLTFPAYVAFFSLLIYFIGYRLRAGETEWTELHIVDVIPHGVAADIRGRSYGSIYSPVNARYLLENEVATATLRGEFAGNYGQNDLTRGVVEQRPAGFRSVVSVPVWTSQLFLSDWWRQSGAGAPIELTVDAGEVRVINRLDRPLRAARVIIGRDILVLGDVDAGSVRSFRRRELRSSSLDSFVPTVASSFAAVVNARQQAFSGNRQGRIDDWTNAVLAISFVSGLGVAKNYESINTPRGFDLRQQVDHGKAVLVGWVPDYSMLKPMNQFPARRQRRDTVFRVIGRVDG